MASKPFEQEKITAVVARSHGRPVRASAIPPQRSTTGRPSTYALHAAPTSPRSVRFAMKTSMMPPNPDSTKPWIRRPSGSSISLVSELIPADARILIP
jgi:hypothetical protein